MLIFEIQGVPIPWTAPRRNRGTYYNPKHIKKEQAIWQVRSQKTADTFTTPIWLDAIFVMPIPKSTSFVKKRQMLAGIIHHIGKPDRSNLLKFAEDVLEGAGIIANDSLIWNGNAKKVYGDKPKTILILNPDVNQKPYEN